MTNAKLDFCRYLIFIIFSKKSLNTTMKCSFIIQQHTSLMVIISTQPTGGGCRPIAWRADLTLTNHAKSWSNADQSGGGRAVLRPPITLRGCFFRFLTLLHDVESTVTTQSFTLSLSFSIGQTHSAQLVVLCGGGGWFRIPSDTGASWSWQWSAPAAAWPHTAGSCSCRSTAVPPCTIKQK